MDYFERNAKAPAWQLVTWPEPIEVTETRDEAAVKAAEKAWLERLSREQNAQGHAGRQA